MTDPETRLVRAIEELGADYEPPAGWQARVLAAVAPRPRARLRWWFAVPVAAVVVGAVVVDRWTRPPPLDLVAAIAPGPRIMRGDSGEIRATARGGDRHRALWIYRDGRELVAMCPGHAACHPAGDALAIALPVERIGNYQVVAVTSRAPLPVPAGSYEIDLAAASDAGAIHRVVQLEIR
jgi:hypothetical protein